MAGTPTPSRSRARSTVRWTSGTNLLAGVWLLLAPFALTYSDTQAALWNDLILGVAIAVLALFRVAAPLQHEEISWTNFVIGLWLVIAPFALGYADITAAVTNDVVVGIIVLCLAAWSAVASRKVSPAS